VTDPVHKRALALPAACRSDRRHRHPCLAEFRSARNAGPVRIAGDDASRAQTANLNQTVRESRASHALSRCVPSFPLFDLLIARSQRRLRFIQRVGGPLVWKWRSHNL
jgi:hypothetical protein